jgi:mannose/fructose/N-acetylgalactosamine-specific phosphotransferase system component IID
MDVFFQFLNFVGSIYSLIFGNEIGVYSLDPNTGEVVSYGNVIQGAWIVGLIVIGGLINYIKRKE